MPPEVPLLPFKLKCLPFALRTSRTSTYEITCIYVYTQLKHESFLSELYTFVNFILRVSYGCVCAHRVYMHMRVCIGVSAYIEFICMCMWLLWIHPPHRCGISRCSLDSMIIAQVCHRLAAIKGHSKMCSFTVLGRSRGGGVRKPVSIWCDHHLPHAVQHISFA